MPQGTVKEKDYSEDVGHYEDKPMNGATFRRPICERRVTILDFNSADGNPGAQLSHRLILLSSLWLALAVFQSLPVAAQTTSILQGTVTDQQHLAIVGAEITINGPILVGEIELTNDSNGSNRFSDVPLVLTAADGGGFYNGVDFRVGRNHFQAPPCANLDARFSRRFAIGERVRLKFGYKTRQNSLPWFDRSDGKGARAQDPPC
jgi:hypothetical protein